MSIAIIGLNFRIPGADTLKELYDLLRVNATSISKVPETRWDKTGFGGANGPESTPHVDVGGFLNDIDCFDHRFFGMTFEEASRLDPQERLFLESVWCAFEDAGCGNIRNTENPRISLYVGCMWHDYTILSNAYGEVANKYGGPGSQSWSIANRVSHFMGLQGQSVSVNTACSSTAYAIHQACLDLERNDSYMAVAGGVNLIVHPSRYVSLAKESLLTDRTEKFCFEPGSEGFIPAEGVGAFVLKKLKDAEADGDHIYATISGSAARHNGRSMFYKTPNPTSQAATIHAAIKKAGILPEQISHIEMSAYGSETIDGAELIGLQKVFASTGASFSIGAVKPNTGHAEAASGVSQLAKVILQLNHGKILPSRFSPEPLEEFQGDNVSFIMHHQPADWTLSKRGAGRNRIAGISSFGAGGTNVHLIVSEYKKNRKPGSRHPGNSGKEYFLIPFSAKNRVALRATVRGCYDHLTESGPLSLAKMSCTLIEGREHFHIRLMFVVQSFDELLHEMRRFLQSGDAQVTLYFSGTVSKTVLKQAETWLGGKQLTWKQVGTRDKPGKIPLPPYAFEKRSCWLGESDEADNRFRDNPAEPMPPSFSEDRKELLRMIGEQIGIATGIVEKTGTIGALNISSKDIVALNGKIEEQFGSVPKTLFFRFKTIDALATYLSKQKNRMERKSNPGRSPGHGRRLYSPVKRNRINDNEIAIIGLSGKYPCAANIDEFWENLKSGKNCITPVPKKRWRNSGWWKIPENNGNYLLHGGFLEHVSEFDPLFFEISPKEAELIDPQERLLLQVAWETIEDAGYTCESLQTGGLPPVGVFVGAMWTDYQLWGLEEINRGNLISASSALWSIPNRISHCFNFNGPSIAVDSACSGSLSAIHLACESIRSNQCAVALAGGVSLSLHPAKFLYLSQRKMASKTGRCSSYGEGGDGFVPGEGVGAVLLKDKDRALSDGDHIYGTIVATKSVHAGKSNGYLVPTPEEQGRMIYDTLKQADIDARCVSYVEGHGTGTSLGDPVEIEGLSSAFTAFTDDKQFCSIGSVKSNIGHCEAAAGIAGLTKVLLQMKHKKIAPSLHSSSLNPNIDFDNSPFIVNQYLKEWACPVVDGKEVPRIAGISSFGAGGSNSHLIVKEHMNGTGVGTFPPGTASEPAVIVLSARNGERLHEYVANLVSFIRKEILHNNSRSPDYTIQNVAYTLQVGRKEMEERLGILTHSFKELEEQLVHVLDGQGDGDEFFFTRSTSAAAYASDEDMLKTIDAWISKRKYQNLLDLWVNGFPVEWRKLYGKEKPKRLRLPTYPFARELYWIHGVPGNTASPVPPAAGGTDREIHPLLHKNISDLYGQRYRSRFTGDESFLRDHLVRQKKTLPGVVFLEMARAAVEDAAKPALNGPFQIKLKDVEWIRPFVAEGHPGDIHTSLIADENGHISFSIYVESPQYPELRTVHCNGTSEICGPCQVDQADLTALQKKMDRGRLEPEVCYDYFKTIGLSYGPSHKGIREIALGKNQLLATIVLPETGWDTCQDCVLHPGVMDSVLQSSLCINLSEKGVQGSGARANSPYLPFGLNAVEIIRPASNTMHAWVRTSGKETSERIRRVDIDVYDETGRLSSRLKGLTLVKAEVEVKQANGPETGTLIARPVWKEGNVSESTGPVEFDHHAIVNCGIREITCKDLKQALSATECFGLTLPATSLKEIYTGIATQLFGITKKMAGLKSRGRCLIQVLVPSESKEKTLSGLAGLLKTVKHENPNIFGQLIEIDPDLSFQAVKEILRDNLRYPDDTHIRYSGKKRQTLAWENISDAATEINCPWKDNGIYLITGGMGGLGKIFAGEILDNTENAMIVLTGRTPLTQSMKKELRDLNGGGDRAVYEPVDIRELDQVRKLVDNITKKYGGLQGIIHSAGILSDSFIIKKTTEEFQKVLGPKVEGTLNLDIATSRLDLDFIALFSSTAGILGNMGQADYSTANAFMDRFAEYRNTLVSASERSGHTVSINWPLWEKGGMRVDSESEKRLAKTLGMVAMTSESGIKAFYSVMARNLAQAVVIEGYTGQLESCLNKELKQADQAGARALPEPVPGTPWGNLSDLEDAAAAYFRHIFSEILKIPPGRLDPDAPLEKYGIDSILSMELISRLESSFGKLSKTLFFEFQTIKAVTDYFTEVHTETFRKLLNIDNPSGPDVPPQPPETTDDRLRKHRKLMPLTQGGPVPAGTERCDIAIIGMSGRFPESYDLRRYWHNLSNGKDCITEIPESRWNWKEYYSENRSESGVHFSKWGGFIEGVDEFDPLFFNISPREAELMDPQERLFLEHAWRAVEDAGYTRASLQAGPDGDLKSDAGVYAGVMYGEYQLFGAEESLKGHRMGFANSSAGVANRVSYVMNLNGPSITVDTMCSSSLTAVHMACRDLKCGRISLGIAGAANVTIHPNKYLLLSSGQFISTRGHCESFGEGGDGYIPGEGVGVILLKRLEDAEKDGDKIYALIRGGAVNHGGKTNGYTVPNPKAQQDVIERALEDSGVTPREISYIEAHGTGTKLGDPIEITGLTKAFEKHTSDTGFCLIGSAKSNIGHCEAAAGMAGIIKVVMQMRHGKVVPSLHSANLNPNIDFETSPFIVNQSLREWKRPVINEKEVRRIAGVSAFGAGGANAHLLLEEYLRETEGGGVPRDNRYMVPLSAKSRDRLDELVKNLVSFLRFSSDESNPDVSAPGIERLAYTLQTGREAMEERLGILAFSMDDLIEKLEGFLHDEPGGETRFAGNINAYRDTLSVLTADEDFNRVTEAWLRKKNYLKVLELWVKGIPIDWGRLYTDGKPRKMSLPAYPFSRQRFWYPASTTGALPATTAFPRPEVPLHPLLHRNISGLTRCRFVSDFTGRESIFRDHVVTGEMMLPAVAYLEMAREAVTQAGDWMNGGGILTLSHVNWVNPFVLKHASGTIMVDLKPGKAGDVSYRISSLGSSRGKNSVVIYSQGKATLKAPGEDTFIDIATCKSKCNGSVITSRQCYGLYKAAGIEYGPSHQGVSEIFVGENQAVARLMLPPARYADGQSCILHPGIMDSALQASSGIYDFTGSGAPFVPFAMDEMQVIRRCEPEMWAVIKASSPAVQKDTYKKFDIDLCNTGGRICVSMTGIAVKPLKKNNIQTTLAPGAAHIPRTELITMAPVWSPVQSWPRKHVTTINDKTVIIGGETDTSGILKGVYPDAEIINVQPEDAVESIADELRKSGVIGHVIWISPPGRAASITDEVLIEDQYLASLFCLRTIKAFLGLGYGAKPLKWTVITRQCQPVAGTDTVYPAHASVHGLTGSMIKEYGNWQIRQLDLEKEGEWPAEALNDLPFNPEGELMVYRWQQWYSRSMLPVRGMPVDAPIYRRKGVYIVIGGSGGIGEAWTEYMIKAYQASVIWIGRRPAKKVRTKLERLSKIGNPPYYVSADATDGTAMKKAYNRIKKRFSRIHGLVHSVLVLNDKSVGNMDEDSFRSVVSSKVETTVRMAQVFQNDPLDFVLFFSSMQSITCNRGQGNYAAGCTFTDAFARQMAQEWRCPVKIMNWGYWGSVGIVASETYRKRMKRLGIGSIEPGEAMESLTSLMAGDLDQVGVVKIKTASGLKGIPLSKDRSLKYKKGGLPHNTWLEGYKPDTDHRTKNAVETDKTLDLSFDTLLAQILLIQLQATGLFDDGAEPPDLFAEKKQWPEIYRRWLGESIGYLKTAGLIELSDTVCRVIPSAAQDHGSVWERWNRFVADAESDVRYAAKAKLADTALGALPEVITGRVRATDILFPESSLALVGAVYKNNPVSDYYNSVVGQIVSQFIKKRLQREKNPRIRILEVGAGTGGTSSRVFEAIAGYRASIEEYCYTDISKAFLIHAEKQFSKDAPYLKVRLLDIEKGTSAQVFRADGYDIVIASNVLHAARRISTVVQNSKSLLKKNGLLLLNEISTKTLFAHLTFGLLDGWWLYEDHELRMNGCPGLSAESWKKILTQEGFGRICFPAIAHHHLGQQVIAAESDGVNYVAPGSPYQKNSLPPGASHTAKKEKGTAAQEGCSQEIGTTLEERIAGYLKEIIGNTLKTDPQVIDIRKSLEYYGLDSILVLELNNQLQSIVPDLSDTLFFEFSSIQELSAYFSKHHADIFANYFSSGTEQTGLPETHASIPPVPHQTREPESSGAARPSPGLKDGIRTCLLELLSETLKVDQESLDREASLDAYGLDSILILELNNKLEGIIPNLSGTLFFEYSSVAELEHYFLEYHRDEFEAYLRGGINQEGVPIPGPGTEALSGGRREVPELSIDDIIQLPGVELISRGTGTVKGEDGDLNGPGADVSPGDPLLIHEDDLKENKGLQQLIMEIDEKTPLMGYEQKIYPYYFISADRSRYIRLFRDPSQDMLIPSLGVFESIYHELARFSKESKRKLLIVAPYHEWIEPDHYLVPVGVQQDIEIKSFTLKGNRMRKLRYLVQKYKKSGDVRVEEYKPDSPLPLEDMADLMKQWSKNKNNIIHHTYTCMEDLLKGRLPSGYRAFLTYHNNRICNVIVIEPGEEDGFYLMDQEFYDPEKSPLGHMEYSIVEIIRILAGEDAAYFSLGITWYPFVLEEKLPMDAEIWKWLHGLNEKQTLLSRIFQQGKPNYQFKKKFRAEDQPVYAYLPEGAPLSLMLSYWPIFYRNSYTYEAVSGKLELLKQTFNPGKGKTREKLPVQVGVNHHDREKMIDASGKIEEIDYRGNTLDLLTDSWFGAKAEPVVQRASYLKSISVGDAPDALRELFPFRHVILTEQGRIAEQLFYGSMPKTKKTVLTAIPWTTTLMHQLKNGFNVVELPVTSALRENSGEQFKGEIDLSGLKSRLKAGAQDTALIGLELLSNATGGHPVRMSHIGKIKTLAEKTGIPLVMDASRVVRNAALVKRYEQGFKRKTIWEITRQSLEFADHVVMSLTKDFSLPVGGLIATNDDALAEKIKRFQRSHGLTISVDSAHMIVQGLYETDYILDQIEGQLSFTVRLRDELLRLGAPVITPADGHAILVDVSGFSCSGKNIKETKELFLRHLFIATGIRGGIHQAGKQKGTILNRCIRLALPVGMGGDREKTVLRKLRNFFSDYTLHLLKEDGRHVECSTQ